MHKIKKYQFGKKFEYTPYSLNTSFPSQSLGALGQNIISELAYKQANMRNPFQSIDLSNLSLGDLSETETSGDAFSMINTQDNSGKWQQGLSAVGSILGAASGNDLPTEVKSTREGIRSAIGQIGPWGAVIAAATGVVDTVGDLTGLNLDTLDRSSANRFGAKGASVINDMMNSLPGNSMLWGMFGSDTEKARKSQEAMSLAANYGSSMGDIDAAMNLSNKHVLFGRNKINKGILDANRQNDAITQIALDNNKVKNNMFGMLQNKINQNTYLGYQPGLSLNFKSGGSIPELDKARLVLQILKNTVDNTGLIKEMKDGGIIEKNVIPEGALHKNKHHIEDANPELEGQITEKGIPVVTIIDEHVEQHAEIEENEIVFAKSNTEQLEEYFKQYQETQDDNIAIECGKFLVLQILKNTVDNTGLIKEMKDA